MKLRYISSVILAATMLTACNDGLDTAPEGATVIESQISSDDINVLAVGLYQELIGAMNTVDDHTDYGIPALHMRLESDGMDMVAKNSGYNHFNSSLTYTNRVYNSTGTLFIWSRCYKIIKACNELLKLIGPNPKDLATLGYMSEAKTLRAYAYFTLAQSFQFTYFGNEDKPCVPIKTEKMTLEEGNNNPRATVKEVYNYILSDLDHAVTVFDTLKVERRDKMTADKYVAHGLRARVRLVMHNYEGALKDADYVLYTYKPYTREEVSRPTFISANDASWVWGLMYTENSYAVTTGIINWPSHLCSFVSNGYTTGGSIYRMINQNLFNRISPSDVRYGWWLDSEGYSPNLSKAYLDFVEEKKIPAYSVVKFAPANYDLSTTYNTQHYPMMRAEEMLFIKAECLANLDRTDEAKEELVAFVKNNRDAGYVCDATTKDELVDEVWFQRRIELWGEGFAFNDIMRLGKDVDRRNSNFENDYQWCVKAGEPILLYRVPKREIEANNGISDKDNNPSADLPTVK